VEDSDSPVEALNTEKVPHIEDLDFRFQAEDLVMKSSTVNPQLQAWAVGGGKGGVGKSLISSSLAISLAKLGKKVIAIDLDLGGANLHTVLGIDPPNQTLSDFVLGKVATLEACLVKTYIPNLEIISGAHDMTEAAQIRPDQRRKILEQMRQLPCDVLILDLGAGTSSHTLDFFLSADIGILTILPEPTSIENCYRFLRACYYRKLRASPELERIHPLVESAMDLKNSAGLKTPSDLAKEVQRLHPDLLPLLRSEIEAFRPKLLVNQARTQTDIDIGLSMKSVCKKYFGFELDYIGYLDYDSAVWQAVRRKRPVMLEFPTSRLATSLERISQFLAKRYGHMG
jgi:flagellar biosynthesis protein FlhG